MRSVEHISRCEVAQYCCAMVYTRSTLSGLSSNNRKFMKRLSDGKLMKRLSDGKLRVIKAW